MTKNLPLKQFVPSDVCLQCDGCCRFKAADSPWRPKLGAQEVSSLALRITDSDFIDDQEYIKTVQHCGENLCRFFDKAGSTCKVYDQRPFECALYPFILSRAPEGIKVFVHLSCPYIQDHQPSEGFEDHLVYLKKFFQSKAAQDFLRDNGSFIHDYSSFEPELLYLFTLDGVLG